MEKIIGIIGIGNMGEAFLSILMEGGHKLLCAEKRIDRAKAIQERYGIEISEYKKVIKGSDMIVLAVKPQDAEPLLKEIGLSAKKDSILISIMAGIKIGNMEATIGRPFKIIRLMPNICIKVKEGIIGMAKNAFVVEDEIDYVKTILAPFGKIIEVEEKDMDSITALGGSGPAFFLLFLEGIIEGGVKCGLSRDISREIALHLLKGVAKILEEEKVHPAILRERITSPAGTTASGLYVLERQGFKGQIIEAIEKAKERAMEISK